MKLRSFLLVLYVSGISLAQAGNTVEAPSAKDKPNTLQAQHKSTPIPDEFKAKLQLANAGDEEAMVDIGLAYMDGTEFLAANEQEAYRWFKKVADRDNTDGDYYLGMLLHNQEKYQQAEQWYRRGAEKGDAYCQYAMGYLYEHGIGVERNLKQAKAWYTEAAEQEHANAQFAMGLFYHDGLGGDTDYQKAREWYERSAGNNIAAAVNNLAVMYEMAKV
ncbi:Beta-lactamase hcpA precursor [Providencia rettgeri]|uniref:Beta-lactamase hcpA n=1 Tax=Providencia rettgeri TaxID=587 RepID=A0A379FLI4_PRORE|nr:Beta-lactamase hcpA precursor [Providencia rettgeri]